MLRTILAVLTATSAASSAALQPRQVAPADSITYCSSAYDPATNPDHQDQTFIPCTRTSSPNSPVVFWFPYYSNTTTGARFDAHFECYAAKHTGDRYLAGHATGGVEPCWISADVLGPASSCPDPANPTGRTCCQKSQLANCCDFRAQGLDLNGYLNETYLHCPS